MDRVDLSHACPGPEITIEARAGTYTIWQRVCGKFANFIRQGTPSGSPNNEVKKPRRSERLSVPEQKTPVAKGQLPSPITHQESTDSSHAYKEVTATPPGGRPNQLRQRTPDRSPELASVLSSPPQDTQAFSQYTNPKTALSEYVKDEEKEGVWGYLLPLNAEYKQPLIMRKRSACPKPPVLDKLGEASDQGNVKEDKAEAHTSGGYLIGRHPECGKQARSFCLET